MENCEDGGQLGLPTLGGQVSAGQPARSLDLCSTSLMCNINDEPFPSMFFDDTVSSCFTSNESPLTFDLLECASLKTIISQTQVISEVRSPSTETYGSWVGETLENSHSEDFSMSITSAQKDKHDFTNKTETSPKAGTYELGMHCTESINCTENCDVKMESKNSTLDMTEDLKRKSSVRNCAVPLPCISIESNGTFEKTLEHKEMSTPGLSSSNSTENTIAETAHEKNLNLNIDICGHSKTPTEQPNKKLDQTIDINRSPSDISHEQCRLASADDGHGTFTKTSEETGMDINGDVVQNTIESLHICPIIGQPSSGNAQPVDGTISIHNTTSGDVSAVSLPNVKNSNMNGTYLLDTELLAQVDIDGGAVLENSPLAGLPPKQCDDSIQVALNAEVPAYANTTFDLPDAESKRVEHQEIFRRRAGVSEQECPHNLDISQSSILSINDALEMKSHNLVTSTPIVLGRDFYGSSCTQLTDMQKKFSIGSIISQSDDQIDGREHDGSDPSETNPSSINSETFSTEVSAKCTSRSSASESSVVNKLAVRTKIPQPNSKSNIPKTQLQLPSISQSTLVAVKSKVRPPVQVSSQPEGPSSALHSMKRTVQLKRSRIVPAKKTLTVNSMDVLFPPQTSSLTTSKKKSTSGCTFSASKPPTTRIQPKPSGLPAPGRQRFGLKPPGVVVLSAEAVTSQTHNKASGLSGVRTRSSLRSGLAQKHASSGALPLAKRTKTGGQGNLSCAETLTSSRPGKGSQGPITASKDIKPKKSNIDCRNCTLLKEKLQAFNQELSTFLQEFERTPPGCKIWLPYQEKFDDCLQEFKRLQEGHQ